VETKTCSFLENHLGIRSPTLELEHDVEAIDASGEKDIHI